MQSYSLDPKCSVTIPYPRLSQTWDGQHALSAICGLSLSLSLPLWWKNARDLAFLHLQLLQDFLWFVPESQVDFDLHSKPLKQTSWTTQVQIFSTYRTWTWLKSSITPGLNTHQLMRVSKVAASLQMSMMKSHENIMCSTDFNQKSKLSERSVCKASFHGMACRRSLHITSGTGSLGLSSDSNSWTSHRDFKLAGICCEAMYSNLMTQLEGLPMKWVVSG